MAVGQSVTAHVYIYGGEEYDYDSYPQLSYSGTSMTSTPEKLRPSKTPPEKTIPSILRCLPETTRPISWAWK